MNKKASVPHIPPYWDSVPCPSHSHHQTWWVQARRSVHIPRNRWEPKPHSPPWPTATDGFGETGLELGGTRYEYDEPAKGDVLEPCHSPGVRSCCTILLVLGRARSQSTLHFDLSPTSALEASAAASPGVWSAPLTTSTTHVIVQMAYTM